jgi:hypothetical protein
MTSFLFHPGPCFCRQRLAALFRITTPLPVHRSAEKINGFTTRVSTRAATPNGHRLFVFMHRGGGFNQFVVVFLLL